MYLQAYTVDAYILYISPPAVASDNIYVYRNWLYETTENSFLQNIPSDKCISVRVTHICVSKLVQLVVNWTNKNVIQGNLNKNATIFIVENQNVDAICKIVFILSRQQYVKPVKVQD